jgi:hypothetical protein
MMSNMEYRRLFDLSRYAAVRELKRLVEENFLNPGGAGRGAHYTMGTALFKGSGGTGTGTLLLKLRGDDSLGDVLVGIFPI